MNRLERTLVPGLVSSAGLVLGAACVDVNGGAVELSWTIQDTQGERRDCGDGPLGVIRLQGQGPGGVMWISDDVDCEKNRLATSFQIDPGRWTFWLDPRCTSGMAADVNVPDPITRDIVDGQVAQLNALLIVIQPGGGSCTPPPDAAPPDALIPDAAIDAAPRPDGATDAPPIDPP